MSKPKLLLALVIAVLMAGFFAFDLGQYLSLEYFKSRQAGVDAYYEAHPLRSAVLFLLAYITVTGLSLPGATIMTLVAGAVFGLLWGTVVVSFASTIGATLAFLAARFLFRDWVLAKFGDRLRAINAGVAKDGAFYLFTLRLVPAFPFFVINLVMALTPIKTGTFFLVSQIGMFAGTIVYVNAGSQLAEIDSLHGILSPGLLASFVLLGLFPLLAKRIAEVVRARAVLRDYPRPARFDSDLVVIGAGSAGLVTSYIAAAVRAKVTLIEKHKMGGDCLNTGCVPSKALIRSAKFLAQINRAEQFGFKKASAEFEFADVMERIQRVIRTIEPHDSVERYTKLGVDCIQGEARITSPYTVEVAGRTLTTRNIVVASGARPFVPPIPGIEDVGYYTSDNLWDLRELPARMVVLGGGPIGCELAQCFARFGAKVTQVEMLPRIMIREDADVSAIIAARFRSEGIDLLLEHAAKKFSLVDGQKIMLCDHHGHEVRIEFDTLLVAVGRVANTADFGLEELGISISSSRTVELNEYLQTRFPNIFACGDVAGPYQFTHVGAHQAWFASVNALFGMLWKFPVDYLVIPWATFTDPEVARVGLNETDAKEQGVPYEVTTYDISDLDRAVADEEAHGLVKVLTVPGKDKILGVTIVGDHAGDVIAEYVTAMRHGLGLNKVLGTIHIYPTLAEANKYAAGNWKKAHAPEGVLRFLERFHRWRRG